MPQSKYSVHTWSLRGSGENRLATNIGTLLQSGSESPGRRAGNVLLDLVD